MYQTKFLSGIQEISAQAWNQLNTTSNPFLNYEFLELLESSGSVSAKTGWQPQHLVVYQNNKLVAAMPLYIKTHSYGEYVFDWAWARAYQENGFNYYPKLVTCLPFTPTAGPRLLVSAEQDFAAILEHIISSVQSLCLHQGFSGWHCLFPTEAVSSQLQELNKNLLQRLDVQFHWHNRSYKNWDDFVAQLQSRKRKNILKERQAVKDQGIGFEIKMGDQISARDWQDFYGFYCNTYLKRSQHKGYLTEAFFMGLGAVCGDQVVMVTASHQDKSIAAALFFQDEKTLYGRYWGCNENYDFLHFETCYYQGIEHAITQGLERFDGGAQGEHKIARGFEPQITYSNHWIQHPGFRKAIEDFLRQESESVRAYSEEAKQHIPYKTN